MRFPTVCPICGKTFVPATFHAYHTYDAERKFVCSYTCARKSEKQCMEEREKQREANSDFSSSTLSAMSKMFGGE